MLKTVLKNRIKIKNLPIIVQQIVFKRKFSFPFGFSQNRKCATFRRKNMQKKIAETFKKPRSIFGKISPRCSCSIPGAFLFRIWHQ